jgi:hypothetical protein
MVQRNVINGAQHNRTGIVYERKRESERRICRKHRMERRPQ